MNTPAGTPEKIYLDLGFEPLETISNDFDSLLSVTWSKDNASGNGVEYVRADLVEKMKPIKNLTTVDLNNNPYQDKC